MEAETIRHFEFNFFQENSSVVVKIQLFFLKIDVAINQTSTGLNWYQTGEKLLSEAMVG